MTEPTASSTSKVSAQAKAPGYAATPEGERRTNASGAFQAEANKSEKAVMGEPASHPPAPQPAAVATHLDGRAATSRSSVATTPHRPGPAKVRRLPGKAASTATEPPRPTRSVARATRTAKLSAEKSNKAAKAEPAPRPRTPQPAAVATHLDRRAAISRSRVATTPQRPAGPAMVRPLPDMAANTVAANLPGPTRPVASATRTTEIAAAGRDEIIASVKRAQQFTLDVVTTWVDVMGKVVPRHPSGPLVPARSDVVEGVGAVFEVAEKLLASQRKFASDLVSALVPAS